MFLCGAYIGKFTPHFFDSYSANTQNINVTTLKINVIIIYNHIYEVSIIIFVTFLRKVLFTKQHLYITCLSLSLYIYIHIYYVYYIYYIYVLYMNIYIIYILHIYYIYVLYMYIYTTYIHVFRREQLMSPECWKYQVLSFANIYKYIYICLLNIYPFLTWIFTFSLKPFSMNYFFSKTKIILCT